MLYLKTFLFYFLYYADNGIKTILRGLNPNIIEIFRKMVLCKKFYQENMEIFFSFQRNLFMYARNAVYVDF